LIDDVADAGALRIDFALDLLRAFFRFNLAGALFTVLELGGSLLYSRYNISAHDKWLKITPWSRDSEMRGDPCGSHHQRLLLEQVTELLAEHLRIARQPVTGVMHRMAQVFLRRTDVFTEVAGLAFE